MVKSVQPVPKTQKKLLFGKPEAQYKYFETSCIIIIDKSYTWHKAVRADEEGKKLAINVCMIMQMVVTGTGP